MVLGIENRTENSKTARSLVPFFGDRAARLAGRLGEPQTTPAADVKLELYWKGVRDWLAGGNKGEAEDQLLKSCRRLFPDIRKQIKRYGGFRDCATATTRFRRKPIERHCGTIWPTQRSTSSWSRPVASTSGKQNTRAGSMPTESWCSSISLSGST